MPYLIEANAEIPSLFQFFWDEYLQQKNVLLILLGSSMGMMETEVLGTKSPLYGRRTAQIKLSPFKFKDARKFYPSLSLEKAIEFYSVAGNIPLYLLEFDERKSIIENIAAKILPKKELLHEEAFFLLKEELRDPATYQAILEAIAHETTATDIAKKVYYYLKDNFLDFWYHFCFPQASLLEENPALLLEQTIKPQLPAFIGKKFEIICREWLWELQRKRQAPFLFTAVGREWGKIQRKAAHVPWNLGKRKDYYIIFAKSFKSREKSPAGNVLLVDLAEMERIYRF